jgi:hypothetical protein
MSAASLREAAIAVTGLTTMFQIKQIGVLMGSEVLLFICALTLFLIPGPEPMPRGVRYGLLSALGVTVALALANVLRGTAPEPAIKGTLLYFVFAANMAGAYALTRSNPAAVLRLMVWISIGFCLQIYLFGGFQRTQVDFWKYGYGVPVTLTAAVVLGVVFRDGLITAIGLALMAALHLLLDFRSMAAICALAAIVVFTAPLLRHISKRPNLRMFIILGLAIVATAAAANGVYRALGEARLLDRQAQYRYNIQKEASGGLVLGARPGLLGTVEAIRRSPIIGRGSYPQDAEIAQLTWYLAAKANHALAEEDQQLFLPDRLVIFSHSFMLDAWVQIGIVGAAFWMFWLIWAARESVTTLWLPRGYVGVGVIAVALFSWNVLFTPFAATERMYAALSINLILALAAMRRRLTEPRAP